MENPKIYLVNNFGLKEIDELLLEKLEEEKTEISGHCRCACAHRKRDY